MGEEWEVTKCGPRIPSKFNELYVTAASLKTSGCGLFTTHSSIIFIMHSSIIFHNTMEGRIFGVYVWEREREREAKTDRDRLNITR